jgi:HlyD family secretion protein
MKKKISWAVTAALILAGLVFSAMLQRNHGAVKFQTEQVTRGSIAETVVASGTVKATTSVDVGSQVSGIIQKVFVDFNSPVKKNQLLARIDPSTFAARVEQSSASLEGTLAQRDAAEGEKIRSSLAVQEADLAITNAAQNIETAKMDLVNAESAVKSSEANLAKAKFQRTTDLNNFKRYEELLRNNYVSLSDKENAENKYEASNAGLIAAEADLKASKAALASARARLQIATANHSTAILSRSSARASYQSSIAKLNSTTAEVRQARASLNSARVDLSRTSIYSPVDGMVINRNIDEGQTVAASFTAPVLFTIARDMTKMQVYTSVDEADIGKVLKGQEVEFTVDAYPLETFRGVISQVRSQPVIANNVVTYYAIVDTPNPGQKLKPGMTANITIFADRKNDILRIPNGALRFRAESVENFPYPRNYKDHRAKERQNRALLWKLEAGKPVPVKVTTGITDSASTELVEGELKEGDALITSSALPAKKTMQGARMRMPF